MLKALRYISLIFFSLIWFVGCSGNFTKFLYQHKIIADEYRFGDLYRLANLPQFRVPVSQCETTKNNTPKLSNTNLYIIGDSFSEAERLSKKDFVANNYQRFFIGDSSFVKLDKAAKNILVIETVERHFRERFAKPYQKLQVVTKNEEVRAEFLEGTKHEGIFDWEVPYKEERHESALFAYDFFLKIKEIKALLNLYLFNKTDPKVALSKDHKYLLYSLDTKPGINSSFDKISEEEIKKLTSNVAITAEKYQKLGFNQVILAIIPNKTSLYVEDLGEYNHLIERVQSRLKVPFIDAYSPIKNNQKMLYDIGDSHWNCEGKQIWVDAINKQLQIQ